MQHAPRRIRQPHLRLPLSLLQQILSHARKRAARARRAHKGVERAARLRPDLGPGAAVVRARVRDVVELVRPHAVGQRLREGARLVVVVRGVLVGDGGHGVYFGAEHFEEVDFFLALTRGSGEGEYGVVAKRADLCVGHEDDAFVSSVAADVREANAGVACSAFHNRTSRLESVIITEILQHISHGRE